jgi:hypothetical protein
VRYFSVSADNSSFPISSPSTGISGVISAAFSSACAAFTVPLMIGSVTTVEVTVAFPEDAA